MVTTQGFNALLKLVEEPPPHLKFIFATTEPDKVIADDPVAHPPLPVPADPAAAAHRLPLRALRRGGRARSSRPPCRWSYGPAAARPATRSPCSTSCSAAPDTAGVTYALATALLGFTPDTPARRGRRRVRGRRRRRPCSASSTRSSRPARTRAGSPRTCSAAARPGDRRRGPGRARDRPDRRARGRRASGSPPRRPAFGAAELQPRRRGRRGRPHRDARRDRAPAAARADLRAGPAARRRRHRRRRAGPPRPARASPRRERRGVSRPPAPDVRSAATDATGRPGSSPYREARPASTRRGRLPRGDPGRWPRRGAVRSRRPRGQADGALQPLADVRAPERPFRRRRDRRRPGPPPGGPASERGRPGTRWCGDHRSAPAPVAVTARWARPSRSRPRPATRPRPAPLLTVSIRNGHDAPRGGPPGSQFGGSLPTPSTRPVRRRAGQVQSPQAARRSVSRPHAGRRADRQPRNP